MSLDDYRQVAPPGSIDILLKLADRVRGRSILHLSRGRFGGGVPDILRAMVPLMTDIGLDARWEISGGDPAFYAAAKALTAALAGAQRMLTEAALDHYSEMTRVNAKKLRLEADLVVAHDVSTTGLVEQRTGEGRWLWRSHIDCSRAQRRAWSFLQRFINQYDGAIFSLPKFGRRLGVPQYVVHPSIDPLSEKNRDLSPREVAQTLEPLGVARDKPLLVQVGALSPGEDPLGVVTAYRLVKKYYDVRLVLAGTAGDDRESLEVLSDLREAAEHDEDIRILELPPDAALQINALQRAATIVLMQSVREGFGLAAAEAMWKAKPLVAGFAGGLPQLVIYDVTGYTVHSPEGAAFRIRHLLNNPELIARMGAVGREHIRRSFLLTRNLTDYLALLIYLTR